MFPFDITDWPTAIHRALTLTLGLILAVFGIAWVAEARMPLAIHYVVHATCWIAMLTAVDGYLRPQQPPAFVRELVVTMALVICIHAAVYSQYGLHTSHPDSTSDFLDCLYFSIVTWTTLGYGDYQPKSGIKLIAASQALMGYIAMGLIIGIFVNRSGAASAPAVGATNKTESAEAALGQRDRRDHRSNSNRTDDNAGDGNPLAGNSGLEI